MCYFTSRYEGGGDGKDRTGAHDCDVHNLSCTLRRQDPLLVARLRKGMLAIAGVARALHEVAAWPDTSHAGRVLI